MSASPSSTSTLASATTAPDPTIIGQRPRFDLGDDDVIADGGTQVMAKEPLAKPAPKEVSALDSLDATITPKAKSNPPPALPPQPPMKLTSRTPTVLGGIGIEVDPTLAAPSVIPAPAPPLVLAPPPVLAELTDDDLQEETRIDRTQPFDRERVVAAAAEQALDVPGLSIKAAPLPAPLPTVVVTEQQPRTPSIAPFAVDIPSAEGTVKIAASQGFPQQTFVHAHTAQQGTKNNQMTILAAAIGGGVALCAAALIALIVFATSSDGPTAPSPATASTAKPVATAMGSAKPREAQQSSIRSAIIETPETTPRKVESALPARDESGTPLTSPGALPSAPAQKGASTPSTASSTSSSKEKKAKSGSSTQPPPPPEPAAVAPPAAAPAPAPSAPVAAAAAPTSTTGTIEIPGSLMTVMVDGEYKRVSGGKIVVSCGRHKVNAGRGTQILDVPCGGSTSAQ